MRSRDAFSYIVLRVVPDIEREEFVNAGVVVFCRPRRFLEALIELDGDALRALDPDADLEAIHGQLEMARAVAAGTLERPPFGSMSQSQRFHGLSTPRSSVVQPGPLHAGTTHDPAATLAHLFETVVRRP
jgi:hypothetical protein